MNSPEMKELERELRALVPRGPRVELARLMYRAGQASLATVPPAAPFVASPLWRGQWGWPVSTAALSVVAGWLGVMLVISHNRESLPKTAPRAVVQPHPFAAPSPGNTKSRAEELSNIPAPVATEGTVTATFRASDAHYLKTREAAIDGGADALPAPLAGATNHRDLSNTVRGEMGILPSGLKKWSW